MSKRPVWFATTSVDVNTVKPIFEIGRHYEDPEIQALSSEEKSRLANEGLEMGRRYRAGLFVEPDTIGKRFALAKRRKTSASPQPFMKIEGFYVVTAEVRELLERLDPGPLHFHAIEVLNTKRTGPLWEGADLHVMQVLTCRREVILEESEGIVRPIGKLPDGTDFYSPSQFETDNALVVTPLAKGSAEMWINDQVDGALFLSDRVASALKAAKLTRGWGLKRCAVKTLH